MSNAIDGLEARLNDLPSELVDDCIRAFTVIAERNGGRMIRGKYQLTAKVAKRYDRPGSSWVLMEGVPSGFWVWREHGTGPHDIKPKRRRKGKRRNWKPGPMGSAGLVAVAGHPIWGVIHHKGAAGDLLWSKTCKEGDAAVTALINRHLEKVNGHG